MATQIAHALKPVAVLAAAALLGTSLVSAGGPQPVQAADPDGEAGGQIGLATTLSVSPSPAAASQIVVGTFYSPAMQEQRSFQIYLPASYGQASDHSYPALFL